MKETCQVVHERGSPEESVTKVVAKNAFNISAWSAGSVINSPASDLSTPIPVLSNQIKSNQIGLLYSKNEQIKLVKYSVLQQLYIISSYNYIKQKYYVQ